MSRRVISRYVISYGLPDVGFDSVRMRLPDGQKQVMNFIRDFCDGSNKIPFRLVLEKMDDVADKEVQDWMKAFPEFEKMIKEDKV